jgi:hypothetical protein
LVADDVTDAKKGLWTALAEFQHDAPKIAFDATNPHFKNRYPSLAGIMDTVRPGLTARGVVVSQVPTFVLTEDGTAVPALTTRITHAPTGEFIEGTMLLLAPKSDPQGQGSALTYAVLAMLGLVGDEDDDGQAASGKSAAKSPGKTAPPAAPSSDVEFAPELPKIGGVPIDNLAATGTFEEPGDKLSAKQNGMIGALVTKLQNVDEVRAWMDANFGKTSRASLTKKEASALIDWLKEQEGSE